MSAGEVATGAEQGALNFDHLDRSGMIAGVAGGAAVLRQQALEPAIGGLAHGWCGGTRRW
jgi:hypothetical protein